MYGPKTKLGKEIHADKYRAADETFEESQVRLSSTLCDTYNHKESLKDIMLNQRFLAAGRVQASIGAERKTTALNCYVQGTIEDSMDGIMQRVAEAAETMRLGGGIGMDYSTLRPRNALIKSLQSKSSGPISFMRIWDAVCSTISSAGHRRGAMMGVLRVDHPDIYEFINCKKDGLSLTNFNISVGVTDKFMEAVQDDADFDLMFEGAIYETIKAKDLWGTIMENTWDWAEPGVLFLDRINNMNNLHYCETIAATNPCAEQCLPPHGACLLGSFNLVKYVKSAYTDEEGNNVDVGSYVFDEHRFIDDIPHIVRAMDNVIDEAIYPLPEQAEEAYSKRRMGLGVTGLANAGEAMGYSYGSPKFIKWTSYIMGILRDECYRTSALLAKEKGAFPLYSEEYLDGAFVKTLPQSIREMIGRNGIRNSHLISIAPTGTISLTADNVSSGAEPPFRLEYERTVKTANGEAIEIVSDYGYSKWGISGKTANEVTIDEHINVLLALQEYTDSAVSKTLNVPSHVSFSEFKDIYMKGWKGGGKGLTTFRDAGKRMGILRETEQDENEGAACFLDPVTGEKSCG